jgi:hypothetical protein
MLGRWWKVLYSLHVCLKSRWVKTAITHILSLGGQQSHCYITGLEGMLITCAWIFTESCELLITGTGGRKKVVLYQRVENSFWRTHNWSLSYRTFPHVNSLMFPEVWFLRKLYHLQKSHLLWVLSCLLRCDFWPKDFSTLITLISLLPSVNSLMLGEFGFKPKGFLHWLHW